MGVFLYYKSALGKSHHWSLYKIVVYSYMVGHSSPWNGSPCSEQTNPNPTIYSYILLYMKGTEVLLTNMHLQFVTYYVHYQRAELVVYI